MAGIKSILPNCGLFRTSKALPEHESEVPGGVLVYFHNHGDFKEVIKTSARAWTDPTMNHSDGPPQTAPLAFAGLGLIGILASLKRFNS